LIRSFLSLFSAYRALEAELREAGSRRILLEDQVRHLSAAVDRERERAEAAQQELIKTLKERPAMPPVAESVSSREYGVQGRARVQQGYADFIRESQAQLEQVRKEH
jgi:hypothetical protein